MEKVIKNLNMVMVGAPNVIIISSWYRTCIPPPFLQLLEILIRSIDVFLDVDQTLEFFNYGQTFFKIVLEGELEVLVILISLFTVSPNTSLNCLLVTELYLKSISLPPLLIYSSFFSSRKSWNL